MISALTRTIIKTFFGGLIQSFVFAVLISTLLSSFNGSAKDKIKNALLYLKNRKSRIQFYFFFYTYLLYNNTVLSRACVYSPLSDVLGGWKFVQTQYNGLSFDVIANILMFVPLTFLLFAFLHRSSTKKKIVLDSLIFAFLVSASIESLQLIFLKGTFQFSDLVLNTVGGLIGGLLYILINHIHQRRNQKNG